MLELLPTRAGPTLLERLAALIGCLEDLRSRFWQAVARVVGRSIASAVSALLRFLLGATAEGHTSDGGCFQVEPNDCWQDDEGPSPDVSIPAHLAGRHDPTTAAGYVVLVLSWLTLVLSWLTTLLA